MDQPIPTLPRLADCDDDVALGHIRGALMIARATLDALRPTLNSCAAADRIEDISAMLEEEITGIASLCEHCAEEEAIDRQNADWINALTRFDAERK